MPLVQWMQSNFLFLLCFTPARDIIIPCGILQILCHIMRLNGISYCANVVCTRSFAFCPLDSFQTSEYDLNTDFSSLSLPHRSARAVALSPE
jgi:hypothetical protein